MSRARQLNLMPGLPRSRPRRVLMHVTDAGAEAVRLKCRRCGYDSGWCSYEEGDNVTKLKRGLPCPQCNAGAPRYGLPHLE
jgi:hypothetical protein